MKIAQDWICPLSLPGKHSLRPLPYLLAVACALPLPTAAQVAASSSADSHQAPPPETTDTTEPDVDIAKPGTSPGRSVKPTAEIPVPGTPFRLGDFVVLPKIDITWLRDSNVYSSNTNELSDTAWMYSPSIMLQSAWSNHALNFNASGDLTRYRTYKSEDTDDYRVSGEGRYDVNVDTSVYGGLRHAREHEDRESPSVRNGLTPTIYKQAQYYFGVLRQFGRTSFRLAGNALRLNFDDVDFITSGGSVGTINNDDRDRWQYVGGIRLGYELSPRLESYLQAAVDNRSYVDKRDDLGYERDSDGERYLLGMRWNIPREVKLDAYAGWMEQDFVDPRFNDIAAPILGLAAQWAIGERNTVSIHLDRTIEETTVTSTPAPGVVRVSSGFLNTYASAGVEHRFTEKLAIRLSGSASRAEYEEVNRRDDYTGVSVGGVYRIHPNLFIDLSASERKLKSSVPGENFTRQFVFARIAVPLSH